MAATALQANPVTPPVAGGNDTLDAPRGEAVIATEGDSPSFMPSAVPTPNAVVVFPEERRLTIAILMPPDGSPFTAASKIICNGLVAASKTSANPAEILMIEAPETTSLTELLQTAVVSGADVLVGPLQKERVDEVARSTSLPLPVVALNTPAEDIPTDMLPKNLIMLTIATENEAEYIAQLAVTALTEKKTETETDPLALPPPEPEKMLLITQSDSWEMRTTDAYERVLRAANIPYERYNIDDMNLERLRKKVQPSLSGEDAARYAQRRQELLRMPNGTETEKRMRAQALKRLSSDMAVRRSESKPPFAGILLSLDAQSASVIRSSLPRTSRIWATSTANPGDPLTSSTATALAFDLEGLVFTECPMLLRYDPQSFEARFATAMPYSSAAKRLFAFGADAFSLAQQWAQSPTTIEMEGEIGRLRLDRSVSAVVSRTPQTVVIHDGHLIEVASQVVAQSGPVPEVEVPLRQSLSVKDVLSPAGAVTVKPVVVEDLGPEPLPPSKMLPGPLPATNAEPSIVTMPAATPYETSTAPAVDLPQEDWTEHGEATSAQEASTEFIP